MQLPQIVRQQLLPLLGLNLGPRDLLVTLSGSSIEASLLGCLQAQRSTSCLAEAPNFLVFTFLCFPVQSSSEESCSEEGCSKESCSNFFSRLRLKLLQRKLLQLLDLGLS